MNISAQIQKYSKQKVIVKDSNHFAKMLYQKQSKKTRTKMFKEAKRLKRGENCDLCQIEPKRVISKFGKGL